MRLDRVAVALRPRSAWESVDLGVAMLQQWWRTLYASFAAVFVPAAAMCAALGWASGKIWLAFVALWWLKPLYDRVALHVVSRAVFGEVSSARRTLAQAREWLATGLPWALTLGRVDTARSFHLPVTQLEGQRGRAGRERRRLLGRRTHGYAVWLTIACLHFEAVLVWSADMLGGLLVPGTAHEGANLADAVFRGAGFGEVLGYGDFAVYALAVLVLEPLYVAAGFALYLNRRTLLEGWDLEVALRRMSERRAGAARGAAAALAGLLAAVCVALVPAPEARAQPAARDPHEVIRQVLKDPVFPHTRQVMRWQRRPFRAPEGEGPDLSWLRAVGYAFAKFSEAALWIAAGVLVILGLWWAARMLPRAPQPQRAAYRPPATLFGMTLAPETLPEDLPGAARALLAAGRVREALALLYRGALSALVHGGGIALQPSDTEGEALARVRAHGDARTAELFGELVRQWQSVAYARRAPAPEHVGRLVDAYAVRFPREAAA